MALYELDVPAVNPGALEGGERRYGCCHQTETQGHGEKCVPETRATHIEQALERAGISFSRVRDEDKQPGEVTIESFEHVADEDMRITEAYAEKAGLKSLTEAVREPSVVEELRTAQASIQHALFRLGGTRD